MARPEVHTSDMKVEQRPDVILPNEGKVDREADILIAGENSLDGDYAAALAFAEEPVTIRIEPSSERFAPKVVDLWVNGRGAEQLVNGRWIACGWLPVGEVVTTKRKYVEVLARAKTDNVQTKVTERNGEDPVNAVERFTSQRNPFSILKDANPKGHEWLLGVMRLAA